MDYVYFGRNKNGSGFQAFIQDLILLLKKKTEGDLNK